MKDAQLAMASITIYIAQDALKWHAFAPVKNSMNQLTRINWKKYSNHRNNINQIEQSNMQTANPKIKQCEKSWKKTVMITMMWHASKLPISTLINRILKNNNLERKTLILIMTSVRTK